MPHTKPGKVYKVNLEPPGQLSLTAPTPASHVALAISPGKSVTRYGREWIIGRTSRTRDVLVGRIGFRGGEGMAEVWDDEKVDFRGVAVPAGLTAPFAINLKTLQMALQPRGSDIKLNGLIGAFKHLLNREGEDWQIVSPTRKMTFLEWRSSVTKVTSARFRLKKPNPHYQGTPDLEAVLEQSEAQVATLELQAEESIDTDAPFVRQSQRHVEQGYGDARYVGVRKRKSGEPRESVYNSSLSAEEESIEAAVDPETGEVNHADLRATIEEMTREAGS